LTPGPATGNAGAVLNVTLNDLWYRARQFLIAVIGAGLVLAEALLLTGLAAGFHNEIDRTIGGVRADAWVLPAGVSGPFTAVTSLTDTEVAAVAAEPGVRRADPLIIASEALLDGSAVRGVVLIGHGSGGLGEPPVREGRQARAGGEIVVDGRSHAQLGSSVVIAGRTFLVVGRTHGQTLYGGVPAAYLLLDDARSVAFGGKPLETAIVTSGIPQQVPAGLAAHTNGDVRSDSRRQINGAVKSINNSQSFMYVVAAVIIAALLYISALERNRDFAVLKALGASSIGLFASVAGQGAIVAVAAAGLGAAISSLLKIEFSQPVEVPTSAYLLLPVVGLAVGLLASLVAVRRATGVDPARAFAGA
jgi:putative ABC transport system permease protein